MKKTYIREFSKLHRDGIRLCSLALELDSLKGYTALIDCRRGDINSDSFHMFGPVHIFCVTFRKARDLKSRLHLGGQVF